MNKDLKEKFGFTLAEVLITLGIIGIVSAITIPTLINNYKEKVRNNQSKKVYATLNQALRMTISDYDYIPKCYYPDTGTGAVRAECIDFYEKFRNKLRLSKIVWRPYNQNRNSEINFRVTIYSGRNLHESCYI